MTDRTEPAATKQLRREIVSMHRLDNFDAEAYNGWPSLGATLVVSTVSSSLTLSSDPGVGCLMRWCS